MEVEEYQNIFENEETHFFYVSTHRTILSLARKYLKLDSHYSPFKVLDAGCGTGGLTKKLERFGQVWGIDVSPQALKFCQKRRVNFKLASITQIPFEDETFDLLVSVDTLCQQEVKNDRGALKEFYRVLKPGGFLILRLPALTHLHRRHDEFVHSQRRYGKKELETKLKEAGFDLKKLSFVGMVLYPLILLKVWGEKILPARRPSSEIKRIPYPLNKIMEVLLLSETDLLKVVNLPLGIGLVAVAVKPQNK